LHWCTLVRGAEVCVGAVLAVGVVGAGATWWVTVTVTERVGALTDREVIPDEQAAVAAKVPAVATAINTPSLPQARPAGDHTHPRPRSATPRRRNRRVGADYYVHAGQDRPVLGCVPIRHDRVSCSCASRISRSPRPSRPCVCYR
jgi:hypothetical protein